MTGAPVARHLAFLGYSTGETTKALQQYRCAEILARVLLLSLYSAVHRVPALVLPFISCIIYLCFGFLQALLNLGRYCGRKLQRQP